MCCQEKWHINIFNKLKTTVFYKNKFIRTIRLKFAKKLAWNKNSAEGEIIRNNCFKYANTLKVGFWWKKTAKTVAKVSKLCPTSFWSMLLGALWSLLLRGFGKSENHGKK